MKDTERLGKKVFIFIIISGLINYYVLTKLFNFFKLPITSDFFVVWAIGSFSYLIGAELLRHFNTTSIKSFNIIFSTWLGVVFTFFWTFGLYEIINLIYPIPFSIAGAVIIISVILIVIYSIYNASTFSVRTIRIESEKLHKSFKIVQLSDIHIGATHNDNFLPKTIARVNALKPDFVVITGDLLDGMHHYKENEFLCLNNIEAPVFFTLGNHENFIDMDRVYNLLGKTKLNFVRNRSLIHEGIQIIGIDDFTSKKDFNAQFDKIVVDKNKFTLLLYHRPCSFDYASKEDIDLMLSGHTHGGQIFPINLLLSLLDGPVQGLHKKNNSILYVSPGTGWWGPPMRLGTRNEITVIELIPKYVERSDYPLLMEFKPKSKISHFLESNDKRKTAEVISLRRGKNALITNNKDKHSKVLFPVDNLVNIKAKLKKQRIKRNHKSIENKKKKAEKKFKKAEKRLKNHINPKAKTKLNAKVKLKLHKIKKVLKIKKKIVLP